MTLFPTNPDGTLKHDINNKLPIADQLDIAYDLAQQTKRRVRLKMSKRRFLLEQPNTPPDPRLALTGKTVIIDFETYEKLTVKELREICMANPNHPLASQKRMSVANLSPKQVVAVLLQDLQEIRQGFGDTTIVAPDNVPPPQEDPAPVTDSPPLDLAESADDIASYDGLEPISDDPPPASPSDTE